MGRITKKTITNTDISTLINQKNPQLRSTLRGMRSLFEEQEKKFLNRDGKIFSFAYDKMSKYYDEKGRLPISRMKRSDLQKEVGRLQEFFKSETSTIPGTYKVMLEQDARIFGVDDSTGKPLKRMTLEQRTNFWASYNEFVNMMKESYIERMTSERIQQYLGDMIINKVRKDSDFMFTAGDFAHLQKILEENQDRWEMESYGLKDSDVFSGNRSY